MMGAVKRYLLLPLLLLAGCNGAPPLPPPTNAAGDRMIVYVSGRRLVTIDKDGSVEFVGQNQTEQENSAILALSQTWTSSTRDRCVFQWGKSIIKIMDDTVNIARANVRNDGGLQKARVALGEIRECFTIAGTVIIGIPPADELPENFSGKAPSDAL